MAKQLPAGTIKRLHVDRRILAQNIKTGKNKPAITIQTSKGPLKAKQVFGRGRFTFNQADGIAIKPLKCGARVWITTDSALELH